MEDLEGRKGEVILAAANPLFGRGVFVFLKMPESWKVIKTSMPPECNSLGREFVGNGFRWITSGFIHIILVNEQKNQAYPLFLEVEEFLDREKASEIFRRKFSKLVKEGKYVEAKKLRINDHEAQYATWISQKRMLLKRKKVIVAHLGYATYCNATRRLLFFRASSSHVENFMRDEEKILSILSSVTCHL